VSQIGTRLPKSQGQDTIEVSPFHRLVTHPFTVAQTKDKFFTLFTRPLNSIYRRVLDELLVEVHLLTVHHQFRYDPFFGLGLVTAFDRFMDGYRPAADKEMILVALAQALGFSAENLRQDAKALLQVPGTVLVKALSQGPDPDLQPESLREFCQRASLPKYSRLFALGLSSALEEYFKPLTEAQRMEHLTAICKRLGLTADRVKKDLDFYSLSLEQVRKSKEALDEMMEAARKKRQTSS